MAEGLSGRKYASLVEDNKTAAEADINTAHGSVAAGKYTSSAPTLANGDFGFLRLDSSGNLKTTATISGDVNVDNTSLSTNGLVGKAAALNADFSTAYASATTIDCTGFPTIIIGGFFADDVVSIQQIATDGSVTNTYTRDDITLTASGAAVVTLTVAGASFVATDTFIVYLSVRAQDYGAGVVDTLTPRTTLASDDPAVASLAAIDADTTTIAGDTTTLVSATSIENTPVAATPVVLNMGGEYNATPVTLDDGDAGIVALDSFGRINISGSVIDDAAQVATPSMLNVGGEYRASATTYTDGDATVLQSDINGHLKVRANGYDSGTDSNKVFEVNPISDHYGFETLAEVTDGTDASSPFSYYVDMRGKRTFALQYELNGGTAGAGPAGVTLTIEASCEDAASGSASFLDVTANWFGAASFVAAPGATDSDILERDTPTAVTWVKVVINAATNANSGDWNLYAGSKY
jgi:hypothetical protein